MWIASGMFAQCLHAPLAIHQHGPYVFQCVVGRVLGVFRNPQVAAPIKLEKIKKEKGAHIKLEKVKKEPHIKEEKAAIKFEGSDSECEIEATPEVPFVDLGSDEEIPFETGQKFHLMKPTPKKLPTSHFNPPKSNGLNNVEILSVGWNQQGCKLNPNFDILCGDLEWRLNFRFRNLGNIGVFLDTRMFYKKPFSGHCGTYDQDIKDFVENFHFRPWLQDAKALFTEVDLEAEAFEGVRMAAVCKAGHNRSVSAATVLDSVLRGGGRQVKLTHLSKSAWASRKDHCCSTCDRCLDMTQMKKDALAVAYRIWQSV